MSPNPSSGTVPFRPSLSGDVTGPSFSSADELEFDVDCTNDGIVEFSGSRAGGGWNNPVEYTAGRPGCTYSIPSTYTAGVTATVRNEDGDILGRGSCISAPFTVSAAPLPPTASGVTVTQPNYCTSGPAATTSWIYTDPEGTPQNSYQVQIDDQGSFNSPEADSGRIFSTSTSWFGGLGALQYDITYRARVRVWDSSGLVSGWTTSSTWKTPKHAYPRTNFTWTPVNPKTGDTIQFTDTTVFSDGGGGSRTWLWNFDDGGFSTLRNPTHAYSADGNYNVTESVTDSDGFGPCPITKIVPVKKPIPTFKEVSPR